MLRPLAVALCLALPGLLHAQEARTLSGQAHNVTVGISSGVTLQIARFADGSYVLSGAFDNVNLAGDVTGTGGPPLYSDGVSACAPGNECILFSGWITLDSRAGFAEVTQSSFVLSLDLDAAQGQATGVYHVGPLPGFAFEQYGILRLGAPIS